MWRLATRPHTVNLGHEAHAKAQRRTRRAERVRTAPTISGGDNLVEYSKEEAHVRAVPRVMEHEPTLAVCRLPYHEEHPVTRAGVPPEESPL